MKNSIKITGLLLAGLLITSTASAYYVDSGVIKDSSDNTAVGKYIYSGAFGGTYEGYIGNVHLGVPTTPTPSDIRSSFLVTDASDLTDLTNYTVNADTEFDSDGSTNVHWYKFTSSTAGFLDVSYEWGGGVASFMIEIFSEGGSDTALSTDIFDASFISSHTGHYDDYGFVNLPSAGDWLIRITGNGTADSENNDNYDVILAPSTAVPLPPAALLFISALAGFGVVGRKRRSLASA